MAFCKKEFNEKFGVFFPKSVTVGKPVGTKEIADRLAKISTVSRADTYAVLMELGGVMADIMKEGKSAYLEGLGHFRYGLDTVGVKDEKDYDPQAQIKAVRVRFTPEREAAATKGGTATRALVPNGIEWIQLETAPATGDEDTEEPDTEEPGTDTGEGDSETDDPLA